MAGSKEGLRMRGSPERIKARTLGWTPLPRAPELRTVAHVIFSSERLGAYGLSEIKPHLKNTHKKNLTAQDFICSHSTEALMEGGCFGLELTEERLGWEALG